MANDITTASDAGAIMESVLLKGDLSKLTPEERATYYNAVCKSVGLNPLTRPLEYITLQGKLTLYARRDCADQLRKINGISIEVVERTIHDGLLIVHVRAKDRTGRTDEDFGAVNFAGLKGEVAANAILKAITKAKRRATLSISGMGFLDETEVETIPDTQTVTVPQAKPAASGFRIAKPAAAPEPTPTPAAADPDTGEIATDLGSMIATIDGMATRGADDSEFVAWWRAFKDDIAKFDAKDNAALRKHFTEKRPGNKPKVDPAAAAGAA